jgi:hypothetical protein
MGMFEEPEPSQSGDRSGSLPSPLTPVSGVVEEPTNPRIEDYLDRVFAPLVDSVPYARRVELRNELRGHLEALAASYRELESEPGVAVEEALRQFGDPRDLARRYADEWCRAVPGGSSPLLGKDLCVALGCFGLQWPVNSMLWTVAGLAGYEVGNWFRLASWAILTLAAGMTTGLMAPNRSVRGVLYALAFLSLPTLIPNLWLYPPAAGGGARWLQVAEDVGRHVFVCAAAYLPNVALGCGGAVLGKRLRDLLTVKPLVRLVR